MGFIISPITLTNNVSIHKRIEKKDIISSYKNSLNIDVSKYFENIEEVLICRCNDTGYRFYYPKYILGDSNFYETLQKIRGQNNYYSAWRWEQEEVLKFINSSDKVLDIGCGTGNFLDNIRNITSNLVGLEINDLAIETAKGRGLTVIKSDVHSFSEGYNNQAKFDIICAFQVLEHIYEISDFIHSCLKLLKINGKLIIAVPNNNPYLFKHDFYHALNLPPHHIGLWDENSMKKITKYFPIELKDLFFEPLLDFRYWYDVQLKYLLRRNGLIKGAKRIPYVYNMLFKLRKYIKGRNLLAVYTKK